MEPKAHGMKKEEVKQVEESKDVEKSDLPSKEMVVKAFKLINGKLNTKKMHPSELKSVDKVRMMILKGEKYE